MRISVLFVLFVLGSPWCACQGAAQAGAAQTEKPIALKGSQITPLKAILQIASDNRIPLGIVFGVSPSLCSVKPSLEIAAAGVKDAFSQALSGTGYTVEVDRGVHVLVAPDATEHEKKLLNHRFDRFTATDSTISNAGLLLGGYIMSTEGASGFAIDSLSSTSAKTFTIKLQSVTTREIANTIVSQGDRGVWIFRPTPEPAPEPGGDSPVQIYGYKDGATMLEQVTCGISSNSAKAN